MKTYDVTIVGAGPAGAVAAYLCAKSGLEVLILEKKALPRRKSCGGGLTARTMDLLARIDCFDDKWIDQFSHHLQIHLPQISRQYPVTGAKPFIGLVRRDQFDLALTQKAVAAGAILHSEESFRGFSPADGGRLQVTTEKAGFFTRALIGADGYGSRVRRQLEHRIYGRSRRMPALLGVEGDLPAETVETFSSRFCHLFFNFCSTVSYGWVFPRGKRLNVGLAIDLQGYQRSDRYRSPRALLDWFVEKQLNARTSWQRRAGAMIPLPHYRRRPLLQHGNVLLAGDAAGFADAWTGEGIYYAVKSAVLAHQAIRQRFDRGKPVITDYGRLARREILPELRRSYFFFRFFQRLPRAYHWLAHERIRRLFLPYTYGELSYPKAFVKCLGLGLGYKIGLLKDIR